MYLHLYIRPIGFLATSGENANILRSYVRTYVCICKIWVMDYSLYILQF